MYLMMSASATPIAGTNTKKRELSSPEYSVDSKKKATLSESDHDISDLSESATPPPSDMTTKTPGSYPHIVIPQSKMEKLSLMLRDTFKGEIAVLVQNIVSGVLKGLYYRIDGLETNIKTLQNKKEQLLKSNTSLLSRVAALDKIADQSDQYSRRNTLRISGFKENTGENTDTIIMNMTSTIGCDLLINKIDRNHRFGKPDATKIKHREILIKFTSYRARKKLYTMKKYLKENGYGGVFLNEDLTRTRSKVLFEARKVVKSDRVKGAWSADGNILIKDFADKVHRLSSVDDLNSVDFPEKPGPKPVVEAAVFMDSIVSCTGANIKV